MSRFFSVFSVFPVFSVFSVFPGFPVFSVFSVFPVFSVVSGRFLAGWANALPGNRPAQWTGVRTLRLIVTIRVDSPGFARFQQSAGQARTRAKFQGDDDTGRRL